MPAAPLRSIIAALVALVAGAASADVAYVAADPAAPEVTRQSALASERFWPYQVELRGAWQPRGEAPPLPAGTQGVLVRLDDAGRARIDFGRDGIGEVPIESTDVVERANQVRLGALWKPAPNLVHTLATRLLDPAADPLRALDFRIAFAPPGFLAVFADPAAPGFAELAAALSPLRGRHGVMTVLFPQGEHPNEAATSERLRSLAWPVPFVMQGYSRGYTSSLLGEDATAPTLLLLTREGRLLFRGAWRPDLAGDLSAALDRAFGPELASGSSSRAAP